MAIWQLQEAKNRFSAVVDAALDGEPQRVTRHGRPAVVVLAEEEYARLRSDAAGDSPDFVRHLLSIPPATEDDAFELPDRTRDYRPREIDL